MRNSVCAFLAVALVATTVSACGSAARSAGPEVGRDAEAVVVVQNQSSSDMRIYVSYAGQQVRLGSVSGLQTARFDIPSSIVGLGREVSFVADPLAGQSIASSFEIFVSPGEQVELTIPSTVR